MSYVDALQSTLAAEHAALYVVGYLGAQTSASAQPDLFAAVTLAYEDHRTQRDRLAEQVREAGAEPVAAAAAYDLVDVQEDPAAIRRQAVAVERACAAAYGYLVASSPSAERRAAVDALIEVALRETSFGAAPRPLPGS